MLNPTQHKGIQTGLSPEGVQVVRIHYSADPAKDPDTEQGARWLKREMQGYRGVTDPRWRKEMEIDFDAHGGQLLFPYMLENQERLFIAPYSVDGLRLIAGLDYGTRNPSAFEVLAINTDGDIHVAYEYYEAPKKPGESDDEFRARKGYKILCSEIKRCPYFENLIILADPSLWNKTQESADAKGLMSIADLFLQEGVKLSPGQRGRDFACYEHIDKQLWVDLKNPRLTISKSCTWLWWEIQRLRFSDYSATTQVNQNLKEKIVDRDNHAWDAMKYVMSDLIRPKFFDGCTFQDFPS